MRRGWGPSPRQPIRLEGSNGCDFKRRIYLFVFLATCFWRVRRRWRRKGSLLRAGVSLFAA